jgi:hypothetical protein
VRASAVLTVYNASWCIEQALESVLAQTHPVHEVLVCDDGSTDGTPDLVERRFGAAVRVLRLPHRNASATRRIGLDQATGDWLALLDADDLWRPGKLERQAAFLARHPEVRWVSTDGRYVSKQEVLRESWLEAYFDPVRDMVGDLMPPLVERCFPLMSSMLVERDAYHAVGGLDPSMVYSHDYDLWLRLAARFPGGVMTERLIDYFSGPDTLSRRYEARHRDDLLLMRRLTEGAPLTTEPLRRRAAERAAAIEFDLALACLRTGRSHEARSRLQSAFAHGPLQRRLVAAGGSILPDWALARLMKSRWVKTAVERARPRKTLMRPIETPEPVA